MNKKTVAPTKQINRIGQTDHFKLCKWLDENKAAVLTPDSNRTNIAAAAQKALGFSITPGNILAAMKTLDLDIPGRPKNPLEHVNDKANTVARALLALYESLGQVPPQDLVNMNKGD